LCDQYVIVPGGAVFRIQHLQWLGVAAAAIGCLLLGGASVFSNYNDHQRHSNGVAELQGFAILLEAANAVSTERGPANSAMGAPDSEFQQRHADLVAKRAGTDASLAQMKATFADVLETDDGRLAMERLDAALAEGRRAVDRAANTPFGTRVAQDIGEGIMAMFAAADTASALRDLVSGHIIRETPQLAGELMLANATSALRDQEGRLGSYIVAALVAPPERDHVYLEHMRATEGVIRSLWSTSVSMGDKLLPDPEIAELIQAVHRDFFENALPMALTAAANHTAGNSLSAAQLTADYVPLMHSSELLRAAVVEHSVAILERDGQEAMRALIRSAVLTIAILVVLVFVAIIFRRTLFAPLMRLHQEVLALASGDNTLPAPAPIVAQEVNDIFAGLTILRQRLSDKRLLEEDQRRLNRRLRRLADTDTLTGLLNRRALLNRVDAVFRRADRIGESLAIALFDIDHFKVVNDTHGHAVGDEVLTGVAKLVQSALRTGDTVARVGGEEFVIIMRRVDAGEAFELLERVRNLLAETPVQDGLGLRVTACFGMAMRPAGSEMNWDHIFALADQRLYIAKGSGRNRVVTEGFSPQTRQRA